MSNSRRILAVLALSTGGVALGFASDASAHHNTVSCQSPGVWLIVNSEADKAESFTTNEGHSGDIPAGGSTTVAHSGTSLIVYGTWTNGATNTATGTGDCTVTTTTEPSTTSSTTLPATSSSVVTTPTTTVLALTTTTTAPVTTTVPPGPTSTVAPTTTEPATTLPSTTVPTTEPPPVCEPVYVDLNQDGDYDDPNENSCETGFRLPATR